MLLTQLNSFYAFRRIIVRLELVFLTEDALLFLLELVTSWPHDVIYFESQVEESGLSCTSFCCTIRSQIQQFPEEQFESTGSEAPEADERQETQEA